MQNFLDEMLTIPTTQIESIPIDHSVISYGTEMAFTVSFIEEYHEFLVAEFGENDPCLIQFQEIRKNLR